MNESGEEFVDAEPEENVSVGKETTNPYEATGGGRIQGVGKPKKNLTGMDWFLAILMGFVAAIFVFPSTCLGLLVVSNGSGELLWFSAVIAIGAGIYITSLVLRARSKRSR